MRLAWKPGRGVVPSMGWQRRGGGGILTMPVPQEWRGTSMQVCGLWPFSIGSGTPMVGVPFGRHLLTGSTVCFDPISWFKRAHLIANPSAFFMGLPGLGKSSAVRHLIMGLAAVGVHSMVLGDLKPDYVDLVRVLGGQVIEVGRGRGRINPLDSGAWPASAGDLPRKLRKELREDAHGRRLTMLSSLVHLARNAPPTDREEAILDRALLVLGKRLERTPVIGDVLDVVRQAPDNVREVAIDRGSLDRYRDITEGLEATLAGMLSGRFGDVFSGQTTTPMDLDRPVVFDVSSINENDKALEAAVLMCCWSYGFGQINAANALADAGLVARRHYLVVMDEIWRALRAGHGMVDRFDAITRLNRAIGTGQVMITHTMKDLESLASEEDRAKARGFIERAGAVVCGGLPGTEMTALTKAVTLSRVEQDMLTGWQDPPTWDSTTGEEGDPPGLGKFLIKVGGRPGIPVKVTLTPSELDVNDTNKRWQA